MLIKRKIFFSFASEKSWLDGMNENGYELMSFSPFTYDFEKTDRRVEYTYIPLSSGRKSFIKLNHKQSDPDAAAIYANYERALFKKNEQLGKIRIMSPQDIRLGFLRMRVKRTTSSLCVLAVSAMCAMLGARLGIAPLYVFAAFLLLYGIFGFCSAYSIEKYIKQI